MSVRYIERDLFIGGARHELSYPIDRAIEYEDSVVVLSDPDSADEGNGRFHDLVAFDDPGGCCGLLNSQRRIQVIAITRFLRMIRWSHIQFVPAIV